MLESGELAGLSCYSARDWQPSPPYLAVVTFEGHLSCGFDRLTHSSEVLTMKVAMMTIVKSTRPARLANRRKMASLRIFSQRRRLRQIRYVVGQMVISSGRLHDHLNHGNS